MNNNSVNLYCYSSDYVFLHNFTWSKIWVKVGLGWLKCGTFFYYTSIDVSAQGKFIYNSK